MFWFFISFSDTERSLSQSVESQRRSRNSSPMRNSFNNNNDNRGSFTGSIRNSSSLTPRQQAIIQHLQDDENDEEEEITGTDPEEIHIEQQSKQHHKRQKYFRFDLPFLFL